MVNIKLITEEMLTIAGIDSDTFEQMGGVLKVAGTFYVSATIMVNFSEHPNALMAYVELCAAVSAIVPGSQNVRSTKELTECLADFTDDALAGDTSVSSVHVLVAAQNVASKYGVESAQTALRYNTIPASVAATAAAAAGLSIQEVQDAYRLGIEKICEMLEMGEGMVMMSPPSSLQ